MYIATYIHTYVAVARVGDMRLIIGMTSLLNQYDTLEYGLLSFLYEVGNNWILLVGTIGNFVQSGLHTEFTRCNGGLDSCIRNYSCGYNGHC